MDEKEFIERLKSIPYSKEEYAKHGISDSFIDDIIAACNPKPKETVSLIQSRDPLIRLVNDYDVSRTEIGMIWFGKEVTVSEDYYYVGQFEVDYLCISLSSYEVVILPFDDIGNVMCRCAQNSFLFLDAMIEAARFL